MKDISLMVEDNKKYNYRVGLLIQNKDEVFIEFNPKFDFTTLPGGRIKILESSKEALKREIKEETEVEIDFDKIEIKAIIENFFEKNEIKCHEVYILYKLEVNDKKVFYDNMKNIDSTYSYYKWISKNKLKEARLLPEILIDIINTNGFQNVIVNELK